MKTFEGVRAAYTFRMQNLLVNQDWTNLDRLASDVQDCEKYGRRIYICGNGGSATNAIHMANDFLQMGKSGIKVTALPSNIASVTAIANDIAYDRIFAIPLRIDASAQDILIVLSGSGNSPNILAALEMANIMGMTTYAMLGFDGGKAKALAKYPIHFNINDMQIAEDMQLIAGHMIMQWLKQQT